MCVHYKKIPSCHLLLTGGDLFILFFGFNSECSFTIKARYDKGEAMKHLIDTTLLIKIIILIGSVILTSCSASPLYSQGQTKDKAVREERKAIAQEASMNRHITVAEAANNSYLIGRAVAWAGNTCFADRKHGKVRIFVNSNSSVNPENNMNSVFGIIFPVELPTDHRISATSTDVRVKGRIIAFEKVFNSKISIFSLQRQPIIEAVEVEFSRKPYVTSLKLQFF